MSELTAEMGILIASDLLDRLTEIFQEIPLRGNEDRYRSAIVCLGTNITMEMAEIAIRDALA